MKYAVVENGRNQVIAKEGERILVDGHSLEKGKEYLWDKVLLLRDGEDIKVGNPYLEGVSVKGEAGEQVKGPKVVNFKKKRRKGYARKVGHRQKYTEVMVKEIE
jgi:large subunit ribosomal protein L21